MTVNDVDGYSLGDSRSFLKAPFRPSICSTPSLQVRCEMSLRDTLSKNAEEQKRKEEFEAEKPKIIEDRKELAKKLCDQIKDWLFEYERDGLAKIETAPVQVDEFQFATYISTGLNIDFGKHRIVFAPVGRSMVGELLFDIKDARNQAESRYMVAVGKDSIYLRDREAEKTRLAGRVQDERQEWSKENLEAAIEQLLEAQR